MSRMINRHWGTQDTARVRLRGRIARRQVNSDLGRMWKRVFLWHNTRYDPVTCLGEPGKSNENPHSGCPVSRGCYYYHF
jgi:hypothetical protein